MRILALEPYYGGSHKAFLDGWSARSRHEWTVLTLPAYKWKWRMRHAAVTFADEVGQLADEGRQSFDSTQDGEHVEPWDVVFCSDILNLAEFLGLAPQSVQKLPTIVYFHENQLTYPVRLESERDYQFAVTNMTSALAASSVWFNSNFHCDSFLEALSDFLKKMPDYQPANVVERIRDKAAVYPPGVDGIDRRGQRQAGPLRILWAARWEHDKNPEDFFEALKILKNHNVKFRLSVIGEQFRESPEIFAWARQHFSDHIDRWGYQQSKAEYAEAMEQADVFVSSAQHEFFGITAVEAILAGAYPVLPMRLAYPEILSLSEEEYASEFFYDGSPVGLADKLTTLAERLETNCLWSDETRRIVQSMERFRWDNLVATLDEAVEKLDSDKKLK